jgi:hypothetical protein
MKSKTKSQINDLVKSIGELAKARNQIARRAEQQYTFEVESLLKDQSRDPQRIEHLLDGLLDFCFHSAMLSLYKKLCRYYFKIDPEATASYVYAYRDMWEEKEEG